MKRRYKWIAGFVVALVTIIVVGGVLMSTLLPKCEYRQSTRSYSPDKRFYTQMDRSICEDHSKTRASLILGESGKKNEVVLLDFGSSFGGDGLDLSWRDGPELHVTVPRSGATHRYGPYEEFPRVVYSESEASSR